MKWYLLLIFLLVSSCVTQQKCLQKFPPTNSRDSSYVSTITMVPIYVHGDTLDVNAPIRCPDQEVLQVENSRLRQNIRILNGKLFSTTEIKPDTVFVPQEKIVIKDHEVRIPQPVKYIPTIFKWTFGICIAIVVFLIAWFTKKFWI
jgi:hypothetical protein